MRERLIVIDVMGGFSLPMRTTFFWFVRWFVVVERLSLSDSITDDKEKRQS